MDPNDCLFLLNVISRSTGKPTKGFILIDRMDPNGYLAAAAITARLLLDLFQLSVGGQLWLLLLLLLLLLLTLLLPAWIGH